jgi:hypothetical protein
MGIQMVVFSESVEFCGIDHATLVLEPLVQFRAFINSVSNSPLISSWGASYVAQTTRLSVHEKSLASDGIADVTITDKDMVEAINIFFIYFTPYFY